MGTWGTGIKDNDAFADIYSEYYDLYNEGGEPAIISKKIIGDNWEVLSIEEEKHSLWFALALAQWETKSLSPEVLSKVEEIIKSGADLKIWTDLSADGLAVKKREIALVQFLNKIKSERLKAKPRKRAKAMTPIFETGGCLVFKMNNGNYGGAVVLAAGLNPKTAYNLIATTRLNQVTKPTISDFENVEVLICNFGEWQDRPDVLWCMPDLFKKEYSHLYELIGKIPVELEYRTENYDGKGYLFSPMWTSGWNMNATIERQLTSELKKPKPTRTLTIKQLTRKSRWWKKL